MHLKYADPSEQADKYQNYKCDRFAVLHKPLLCEELSFVFFCPRHVKGFFILFYFFLVKPTDKVWRSS